MELKKRKHFTLKEVNLMGLFLFYCFSFSNEEKFSSGLVSSITMQQFEFFWKLLENLRVNYVYYFQQSLSSLKWTRLRASFYQFSELIFIVTSKHWTETHSLNDKIIVWCKYSRVIKDLSKSGNIFLLNVPNYSDTKLLFSLRSNFVYSLKNIPLKKNPWNLKAFFAKISPHRIL